MRIPQAFQKNRSFCIAATTVAVLLLVCCGRLAQAQAGTKITLNQALDRARARSLSDTVVAQLADAWERAHGNPLRAAGPVSRDRRLELLVRDEYFDCLDAQMQVEVFQRAVEATKNSLLRAQQREAALDAPHSDVKKADLTKQQREWHLAQALHQSAGCKRGLAALLFSGAEAMYSLVVPEMGSMPAEAAFEAELAKRSNALPAAELPLKTEVAGLYETAQFDAAQVVTARQIQYDAGENQFLIQYRYQGGEASIYDVTAGQDTLIAAELELVSSTIASLRSRSNLDRFMAGW